MDTVVLHATRAVEETAVVGEGPVWDAGRACLWWVDVLGSVIHRFDPASGTDNVIEVGSFTGALALRRDGTLLLAQQDALVAFDPRFPARREELLRFASSTPPLRSNDAKCDPAGRLWLDRMALDAAEGAGSLLRIEPDLAVAAVLTGLTIPNGIGWSLDGQTMYFVESTSCTVKAYPYDPATGDIGEGRTFVRFPDDGSVPDGLTVDAEGHLWVARWGASCVVRISPDGVHEATVELPVSQASSCTFGGPDLADLYITSAREDFTADDVAREPLAGSLFVVRPGVQGLLPVPFAG